MNKKFNPLYRSVKFIVSLIGTLKSEGHGRGGGGRVREVVYISECNQRMHKKVTNKYVYVYL